MTTTELLHLINPTACTQPDPGYFARIALARRGYAATEGFNELLHLVSEPDGGFTFDPRAHTQPSTGYALSIHPERSQSFAAALLAPEDLTRYIASNRDLLDLPGNMLGAWHDPASHLVFLDVSTVTDNETDAAALALAHDQIAYYDLARHTSVTVNAAATSGGAASRN